MIIKADWLNLKSSLFTNVHLDKTDRICADTLYFDKLITSTFPKAVFSELMQIATSGFEFSFNNTMYRHTDDIAVASPLSRMANFFVGYHENKFFEFAVEPQFYKRYVNDTFANFEKKDDCNEFFNILNSLNPALKFTSEKDDFESLTFLDIKIQNKSFFTGQYIRWDFFGPSERKKINKHFSSSCAVYLL